MARTALPYLRIVVQKAAARHTFVGVAVYIFTPNESKQIWNFLHLIISLDLGIGFRKLKGRLGLG